jgi:CRP-like cAMP-binding protein
MFTEYTIEDIALIKLAYEKKKQTNTVKSKFPILDKLAGHIRLFSGLDNRDVHKLVEDVKLTKHKKGEVIYKPSSLDCRYYFVVNGNVSIYTKDMKTLVRSAISTQTFGEKYALFGQPRPFVAVATSDAVTLLSFKIIDNIPDSFGVIFAEFYKNVAKELSARDKRGD